MCAILFLIVVSASFEQSQAAEKLIQNPCGSKQNCRDCIQSKNCAWCLQPDYEDKPRCFQPSLSASNGCAVEYSYNPDNEEILVRKEELTRSGASAASAQQSGQLNGFSSSSHNQSYSRYDKSQEHWDSQRQQSMSGSSKRQQSGSRVEYGSFSESGKIVQIHPQEVNLRLRISMLINYKVSFEHIEY